MQSGTQDWVVAELRERDQAEGMGPDSPGALPVTGPSLVPLSSKDVPSLINIARSAALDAERTTLKQVLDRLHWNRREAARVLKVSYRTLRRKIDRCGLED